METTAFNSTAVSDRFTDHSYRAGGRFTLRDRLSVLVPDISGVVGQSAGGATGQLLYSSICI